jgi:transcription factor MYB, plant
MFLADLLGAGEFPHGDHLFGSLLHQDRASSSLPELSACYFPNTQAEMWADAKPPAGLCHSLT